MRYPMASELARTVVMWKAACWEGACVSGWAVVEAESRSVSVWLGMFCLLRVANRSPLWLSRSGL